MKKVDAEKLVGAGALAVIAEYRSSKPEHIRWRDKQTGKAMEADMLRHTVEVGDASIAVSDRLEEGETGEGKIAKLGVKKGQKVLLRFSEITTERGLISARGTLEAITE